MIVIRLNPTTLGGRRRSTAFTLVELLIVIAIIGILIAMLLPAVGSVREAARRTQCRNNMKQLGIALHGYHEAHGALPWGASGVQNNVAGGSWGSLLLPHIEQGPAHDLFDYDLPMADVANLQAMKTVVSTYLCPSDPGSSEPVSIIHHAAIPIAEVSRTSYFASLGPTHVDSCADCPDPTPSSSNYCCQGWSFGSLPNAGLGIEAGTFAGMFARHPVNVRFASVRDGLSNTFMLGETLSMQCGFNGAFVNNFSVTSTAIALNILESDNGANTTAALTRSCGFKSQHPGGAMFVMGDGSVHFIDEAIDYKLYNELGSRAGGEVASLPE